MMNNSRNDNTSFQFGITVGNIKLPKWMRLELNKKLSGFSALPTTLRKELRRADVLLVKYSVFSKNDLDIFIEALNPAGYIYIQSAPPKYIPPRSFLSTDYTNLWKLAPQSDPVEYGEDYIARWGDTDFLANSQIAAEGIQAVLKKSTNMKKQNIIDIGCLNGYIMESLRRAGFENVYGIDISYSIAVKHVINPVLLPCIRVGDFMDSNYPEGSFDNTICMEVLEHIPPNISDSFVKKLAYVTKTGGRVLISTSEDWAADDTHINCRTRREWYYLFAKNGLTPVGKQVIFPGFNSFVLEKKNRNVKSYITQLKYLSDIILRGRIKQPNGRRSPRISMGRISHKNISVGTNNLISRETWLKNELAKIPQGLKILDAGAGELQYRKFCQHLDYTSQDFAQYNGEGDGKGLQTSTWDNSKLDIVSDIANIPVKNGIFDAILCVEVLEHVPHPTEAIKEFARILKPGGIVVITVPVSSLTHFAPHYYYNGYSKYYFEKVLDDFGFEDIVVKFNGNYFEAVAQEVRRLEGVRSMYAVKVNPANWREKLATRVLIRRLDKLSQADTGSSELSSHGLHITAKKSMQIK